MDRLIAILNNPDGLTIRTSTYNGLTFLKKEKSGTYEIKLTDEDKEALIEIIRNN